MKLFQNVLFGVEFRNYQQDFLEAFERLKNAGDRKFYFLAPPGAGKTILGLEMIRRLGEQAVVFTPGSAIQVQWMEKLKAMTCEISISTNKADEADILVLTYQSVTVKERNSKELHRNAEALIKKLNSRKVIVLDECHHLTAFWADVMEMLVHEDKYIVGLTATPPIHREQGAINRYLDLLGEIDYQIPMPAIIKEGYLAPFQDLVFITEPSAAELEELDLFMLRELPLNKAPAEKLSEDFDAAQIWSGVGVMEWLEAVSGEIPFFINSLMMFSFPGLTRPAAR